MSLQINRLPPADVHEGSEGVHNRRFYLCPSLASQPIEDLLVTCGACSAYSVACCQHHDWHKKRGRICHHRKLAFTDGACSRNGAHNATADIGIAMGEDADQRRAIPIDDSVETNPNFATLRTSQRAELLAAIYGVRELVYWSSSDAQKTHYYSPSNAFSEYIIATDSEYVVLGLTEWVPAWKANNWRTKQGKTPKNLDLFRQLEREVEKVEATRDKVGFWWIPRELNEVADGLARSASQIAPSRRSA